MPYELATYQQDTDALKGQYIAAKGNTLDKTPGTLGVLPRAGYVYPRWAMGGGITQRRACCGALSLRLFDLAHT
ncbi:MAG: hypothetical protein QTN59_01240 [Candidatus Electrothrix communis]|nr:hypothetical protein [Desulfobulbus sp. US4]WLE97465.1 MAG: hypothetical protein QTN59_01240 [Candidatus Electrothrix communis]